MRSATSTKRWKFALYNTSNVALCACLSGLLYFLALGREPLYRDPGATLAGLFPAAALLASAYYLSNSLTVAAIIALGSGKNIFRFWLDHFVWHSINYFACTFGAVLIAVHSSTITAFHLAAAGLVVTIAYCAYRNALGMLALNGGR